MKLRKSVVLLSLLLGFFILMPGSTSAQTQLPDYYDFWENGTWKSELTIFNGDTLSESDTFEVNQLESKNAFEESWKIYIGEGNYITANVLRAFDYETGRWRLFYVDNRYAQLWESKLIDGTVYFYKEFTFNGKRFYSKQGWKPLENGKVLRTIERSTDQENWRMRYYQVFVRMES